MIDTAYPRTVSGRVLGYCDLEVNLSGQPGLRLTQLPNADEVYGLILRLLSTNEPAGRTTDPPGGAPSTPPALPGRCAGHRLGRPADPLHPARESTG